MADASVKINGVLHDWESASITGPQGIFVGITELNYKASRKKTRQYGKGSLSRGVTRGQYEASFDMTISVEEHKALVDAAGGSLLEDNPFDLAVAMEPEGKPVRKIAVKDCRVDDIDESNKQGDEEHMIKISGTALMIERDGAPDYQQS